MVPVHYRLRQPAPMEIISHMTNTEEDRVSVVYQTTYTHNQPVLNMMGERVLFCE